MKCKIYLRFFGFMLFFVFSLLFCTSLFTLDSYATTVSCSISDYSSSSDYSNYSFSDCDRSSLDSDSTWYYYGLISFNFTGESYQNPLIDISSLANPNSNAPFSNLFMTSYSNQNRPSTVFLVARDWVSNRRFNFLHCQFCTISSSSIDISDSVSFSEGGITPSGNLDITENGTYDVSSYAQATVDVPPQTVEGDYHDDLQLINNSILISAATILVVYFFFCIYRLIIKGSGS